jgi:F-type H+-transporting ATPase subunit delta
MRPDAVARRYARALFALAKAEGSLDTVASALATVTEAITEPTAMRVLTGPVSRERKRELLAKVAAAAHAPATLRDFLLLLGDHDRLDHAAAIRAVFDALLDRERGITRAKIRAATPLSRDVLDEVLRTFGTITGRKVVATVEIAPELIAGIIVEVEGRVYDGSLSTELEKLQHQMATGS